MKEPVVRRKMDIVYHYVVFLATCLGLVASALTISNYLAEQRKRRREAEAAKA